MKRLFALSILAFSLATYANEEAAPPPVETDATVELSEADTNDILATFPGFVNAELARRSPCKRGDVYCGGECHSSWDKCPGRGRDRDDWRGRDRWRDRYCYTSTDCGRCFPSGWGWMSSCRTIDCRGRVVNSWTQRCR